MIKVLCLRLRSNAVGEAHVLYDKGVSDFSLIPRFLMVRQQGIASWIVGLEEG